MREKIFCSQEPGSPVGPANQTRQLQLGSAWSLARACIKHALILCCHSISLPLMNCVYIYIYISSKDHTVAFIIEITGENKQTNNFFQLLRRRPNRTQVPPHYYYVATQRRNERGRPVRLAYQPLASSTFLSEQISHQQPVSSTLLSEQTSTSHQSPANRTGWKSKWFRSGEQSKHLGSGQHKTPRELGCWFRWQNVELVAFSEQIHTTTPGVRVSERATGSRSIIQVEQTYMLRRTLVHSNGHTSLFLNHHTLTVFSYLITFLFQFSEEEENVNESRGRKGPK
jgi:hypothetical protein